MLHGQDEEEHHHDHDHDTNENLYGIFLHVLADALGSVGVIISSVLVKYYDIQIADPICSSIISVLIFASVIPLIKSSSETLLLKCPPAISKNYNNIINEIEAVPGVLQVIKFQVWTLSGSKCLITFQIFFFSDH